MKVLVFDPGYGDVKYAVVDIEAGKWTLGKFPTLVSPAGKSVDLGDESKEIFWAGRKWLVGREAAIAGRTIPTTTEGFLETYLPLLLGKALTEAATDGVDEVVVAVSIYDWTRRKRLEEVSAKVVLQDRKYEHQVRTVPQGYGIWLEALAPEDGVVIDIGFRTVDVLSFAEGKPEGRHSFGIAGLGVVDFVAEVAGLLSEKAKVEFTPGEVVHFLQAKNGVIQRFGVEEELRVRAEEWSGRLWSRLVAREDFKRVLALKDRVVVAGGGALFFREPEDGFPCRMIVLKEAPEFANVRGIANWILQEAGL